MSDDFVEAVLLETTELQNSRYTIVVRPYLFGQKRIQLTDLTLRDQDSRPGHGSIVFELCTYKPACIDVVVQKLVQSDDPIDTIRSWQCPWNCESRHGRIRLDNTPDPRFHKNINEPSITDQLIAQAGLK